MKPVQLTILGTTALLLAAPPVAAEPCVAPTTTLSQLASLALGQVGGPQTDKEGFDTRMYAGAVLPTKIEMGGGGADAIDLNDCEEKARRQNGGYYSVTLDCSAAIEQKFGAPMIGSGLVYADVRDATGLDLVLPYPAQIGRLVEMYTVTPTDYLKPGKASGIGLSFSRGDDGFFPTADLQSFADVTLESGRPAKMHRFIAMHWGDAFESVSFKPYLRWEAGGKKYHVWENLTVRKGTPQHTGGMGSGNLTVQPNRTDRFVHDDLIRESDLLDWPPPVIDVPDVSVTRNVLDPIENTVRDGAPSYRGAFGPTWSTALSSENPSIAAGGELFSRFTDPNHRGAAAIRMFYSIDGGPEQPAGQLLTAGCSANGFPRCFRLKIPADATGKITYRYETEDAAGNVTPYGNGSYEMDIVPTSDMAATIDENGLTVSNAPASPASFTLKYDPKRAVERAVRKLGRLPQYLKLTAEITSPNGDTVRRPLGEVRSHRDQHGNLKYHSDAIDVPVKIPAGAAALDIQVRIDSYTNSFPDGSVQEGPFTVTW